MKVGPWYYYPNSYGDRGWLPDAHLAALSLLLNRAGGESKKKKLKLR